MQLFKSVVMMAMVIASLSILVKLASAGQRVALVIGNASYAHAPSLANPLNDANDIGAALDRLGFAVTRLPNANRAELWDGLQKFRLAASASEVAVVFYAGHGIEVDKRNFLIPVDARLVSDGDVEFEAVSLDLVLRAVEGASNFRLIILDACRDNPFAVAMRRAGATRSIGRGLASVEPPGETLVAVVKRRHLTPQHPKESTRCRADRRPIWALNNMSTARPLPATGRATPRRSAWPTPSSRSSTISPNMT